MQSLSTFLHAPVLLASLALAACGGDDPITTLPDAPTGPGGPDAGIDAPGETSNGADLSISMQVAARAVVGTSLTYILDVRNFSAHDAADVVVTYELGAGAAQLASAFGEGWACTVASPRVTCTRAAYPSGFGSLISVRVTLPGTPDQVTATATVQSSVEDPVTSNNEASSSTDVVTVVDLSIVQRTDATGDVLLGSNVTYVLEVANQGSLAATEVSMSDRLSRGLSFVRAEGTGWSCRLAAPEVVCTRDRIEANSTAPLLKIVAAVADPDFTRFVTAEARVAATQEELDGRNNTTTTTTGVELHADLGITIADSVDPVQVSSDAPCTAATCITYTVKVTNVGPAAARGANALITLPGVGSEDRGTFVDVVAPGAACTVDDDGVVCTWDSLPVGTTTIAVRWKAPRSVPQSPLFALVSTWARHEERDINAANDEAQEETAVRP